MENRAKTTTDFFCRLYPPRSYGVLLPVAITYATTFEDKGKLELQFINSQAASWCPPTASSGGLARHADVISGRHQRAGTAPTWPRPGHRGAHHGGFLPHPLPTARSSACCATCLHPAGGQVDHSEGLLCCFVLRVVLAVPCAVQQRYLHQLHRGSRGRRSRKSQAHRRRQLRHPDPNALERSASWWTTSTICP